MRIFSQAPNFRFMAYRHAAAMLSAVLSIGSLILIFTKGLNFGMDFTGGLLLEVQSSRPVELADVRSTLDAGGFASAQVQNIGGGTELLIRLPPQTGIEDAGALETRLIGTLRSLDSSLTERRTEFVGPQVGEDLTEQGSMAMLIALMLIFVYVMLRFRWKLALGAIVATVHDVIVTVGFFSVAWLPFDLTVLGAILAVIGYSLNDTIVVFDRVRENFRLMRRGDPVAIMDAAVNQTMSRTIITGLTTLLVLVALFAFGGETLRGFSVALIVGIIVGTYSSIYVASATALALDVAPIDLVPQKREQVDDSP